MSISKEVGLSPPVPLEGGQSGEVASLLTRFGEDKRGTVSMIFGLMVVPCVMGIGLAVDYGRMAAVKVQAQSHIDSVALAAGRAYQVTRDLAIATTMAENQTSVSFSNGKHTLGTASVVVSSQLASGELTTTVTQWVRTPFMSVSDMVPGMAAAAASDAPTACQRSYWDCQKVASAATVKVGKGLLEDGSTLEISVMLDVTGSMNSVPSGQTGGLTKFESMKVAAKAFVDIVLPVEDVLGRTRVALVPFGGGVYPGATMVEAVTAPLATGCGDNVPGCATYKYSKYNSTSSWRTANVSAHCLVDRQGDNKYTDEAPSPSNAATRFPRFYPKDLSGNCGHYSSTNPDRNIIKPLQSNPTVLKDHIQNLTNLSDTAGQIGTAWTWYMLSPKWASLLPVASQPKAYNDPTVKKIAVLMTDGEYNTQYCNGLDTDNSHSISNTSKSTQCTAPTSKTAAEELCKAMKKNGSTDPNIIVYTIGFDLDSTSDEFLKTKCASSAAHHYKVTSGAEIAAAFSDIALKATALVITK